MNNTIGIVSALVWISIIGSVIAMFFADTNLHMIPSFLLGFIAALALVVHFISGDD